METIKIGDFFVTKTNNSSTILIAYAISDSALAAIVEIVKRVQGSLKFNGNFREVNIEGTYCLGMYFYNTVSSEQLFKMLS